MEEGDSTARRESLVVMHYPGSLMAVGEWRPMLDQVFPVTRIREGDSITIDHDRSRSITIDTYGRAGSIADGAAAGAGASAAPRRARLSRSLVCSIGRPIDASSSSPSSTFDSIRTDLGLLASRSHAPTGIPISASALATAFGKSWTHCSSTSATTSLADLQPSRASQKMSVYCANSVVMCSFHAPERSPLLRLLEPVDPSDQREKPQRAR